MKTLFISTTLILTLASFGSAAYANVDNSSTTETCSSIPIAEPTGGATRQRLQAIKRCNEIQSRKQQTPSTSATEQPNPQSLEQQTPSTSATEQPNPPTQVPLPTQ
jgi:hypothetical protein